MDRTAFLLRMPKSTKGAICDRALAENRTQTDLILEAVEQYLSTSLSFKKAVSQG